MLCRAEYAYIVVVLVLFGTAQILNSSTSLSLLSSQAINKSVNEILAKPVSFISFSELPSSNADWIAWLCLFFFFSSSVLCVFLLLWFCFAYLVVVYFNYLFYVPCGLKSPHLGLFLFSGVSYEGINTSCGSVGENCSLSQHHCHYDYRWPADYCYRKSRGANMSLGSFIRIKGLFLPKWWIEVSPFTINSEFPRLLHLN